MVGTARVYRSTLRSRFVPLRAIALDRIVALGNYPPRDRDEARVRHHTVKRSYREPLDVPRPVERLKRLDQRKRRVSVQALSHSLRLDNGRYVGEEDPPRAGGLR